MNHPAKAMRREIAQEEKDEETQLRHAIKDISSTTKEQHKAHKAVLKADSTVAKLGKKESVATAAVQKATHKHDIAATNLRSAQRDAEMKRQEDVRLQRELDEKKARLDTTLQEQKAHKHGRQSRLHELESGRNSQSVVDPSSAGAGMAAGHHGTHPIGARGEDTNVGLGTDTGARSADNTIGNAPGQYDTGSQAPGTRVAGPGYAAHNITEGVAAGAGLAGNGAHRGVTGQGDRIRGSDGPGGQLDSTKDQATYQPSGVVHRSDAGVGSVAHPGERSIGRNEGYPISGNFRQTNIEPGTNAGQPGIPSESGAFSTQSRQVGHPGDDTVRVAQGADTGYPREGPGEFGGPGNVHAAAGLNQHVGTGEQVIPGQSAGYPSAISGTGYSGAGGENLEFRGDPMLGGSGTGADPGIRTGGTRDFGGRGGSRELIGDHNLGLGEPRYGAERIGDHQYTHPSSTGIGGRQSIFENPDSNRDRMVMGGTDRFGPGINQTGGMDSGARGPVINNQGFGEDNMPGGYTQLKGMGNGSLDNAKEHF